MHEMSVASAILRSIEERLKEKRALARIELTVGPLSCICAESLRFCMEVIAEEEGFGNPELDINEVDARVACRECGTEYSTSDFYLPCPSCGSMRRDILSGRECTVELVELIGET